MAVALSKCSKTVTQLRQAYPTLETNLKGGGDLMTEFLKRSSERLDNAWRRCKKLTGTLVTLKRLASVQEQGRSTQPQLSVMNYDLDLPEKLSGFPVPTYAELQPVFSSFSYTVMQHTKWSILPHYYDRGFILAAPDHRPLHRTSRCHRPRLQTRCLRQKAARSLQPMAAKRTPSMIFWMHYRDSFAQSVVDTRTRKVDDERAEFPIFSKELFYYLC